jgi:hypothetical protein
MKISFRGEIDASLLEAILGTAINYNLCFAFESTFDTIYSMQKLRATGLLTLR